MREAHPSDQPDARSRNGPQVAQAKSADQRAIAASDCVRDLKLSMPVLLDDMEATAEKAYRGWPARLVIIGADGNILFCTPASPNGANATQAAGALQHLFPATRPATGPTTRGS